MCEARDTLLFSVLTNHNTHHPQLSLSFSEICHHFCWILFLKPLNPVVSYASLICPKKIGNSPHYTRYLTYSSSVLALFFYVLGFLPRSFLKWNYNEFDKKPKSSLIESLQICVLDLISKDGFTSFSPLIA